MLILPHGNRPPISYLSNTLLVPLRLLEYEPKYHPLSIVLVLLREQIVLATVSLWRGRHWIKALTPVPNASSEILGPNLSGADTACARSFFHGLVRDSSRAT